MTEMSNGELARAVARVEAMVRDGFESSHQRIDGLTDQVRIQNGRTTKLERTTDVAEQKIVNLEREVFSRPRAGASSETTTTTNNGDSTPITRRDLQVAVFAIAALFAAIRWLPALFTAAQGAP